MIEVAATPKSEFKFRQVPPPEQRIKAETSRNKEGKLGVQGALLLAKEGFTVKDNAEQVIKAKLDATDLKGRWDFKELNKVSRKERKGTGTKYDVWKVQMHDYLKFYKDGPPASKEHYEVWKDLLCKSTGLTPEEFDRNVAGKAEDQDPNFMRKIASNIYNKDGSGTEKFIKASLESGKLNSDPNYHDNVREVAKVLFGERYTENVLLQIQGMELRLRQGDANTALLARRVVNKTKNLTAEENYIISEIKRIVGSDEKKDVPVKQKVIKKELEKDTSEVVVKQTIGLKSEQQDYVSKKKEGLPKGVKSITLIADGHGKDGKLAGQFAGQFFEAHFIDIKKNNPTISTEDAINLAIEKTDAEVCAKVPNGGSTLTAAIKADGKVYIAHIGDSRASIVKKDGTIETPTKNHTWKDEGKTDGKGKYKYNLQLSRSIGDAVHKRAAKEAGDEISNKADIIIVDEKDISQIILCSDGMYNKVSDEEIQKDIQSSQNMEEAATKMMGRAKKNILEAKHRGETSDNATVVIVKM
ncbi:MAG: PP2C family protein-serine/threonine phosphatase [Patescibacteria group bacterium]|jgi:protein phosphatase